MKVEEIQALLEALAMTETNELTLETPDYKLAIKRGQDPVYVQAPQAAALPASAPAAPAASALASTPDVPDSSEPEVDTSNFVEVTAPIVGTFYAAPAPDAPAFAKVGDTVSAGSVLCIIEAMKLMNEIEAEVSGTIREILVTNEDPVEYGQVLFRIEPN
jgi:acetyl-CoA carboxylase biotin carboxyl carrier protein